MHKRSFDRTYEPDIDREINISYGKYAIYIYGFDSCDCIEDETLSIRDPQTCIQNKSNLYGYFKDTTKKHDNIKPFVINNELQLLAPDNSFKLDFKIEQTKERINEDNMVINKDYKIILNIYEKGISHSKYLNIIYPVFNWVKEPIDSIVMVSTNGWEYQN